MKLNSTLKIISSILHLKISEQYHCPIIHPEILPYLPPKKMTYYFKCFFVKSY